MTRERVDHAMTLPGGGRLRVGPGQITDDGELTLTLFRAMEGRTMEFPMESVANGYAAWYDSYPFDIGRTCSLAFECLSDSKGEPMEAVLGMIREMSATSEANGAMMRATPIAAWWASLDTIKAEEAARHAAADAEADAQLSHPSIVTRQTNAVYVYALTLMLQGTPLTEVVQQIDAYDTWSPLSNTVKEWIEESKKEWDDLSNAQMAIGHVRHGFVMALWFLRHPEIGYREALFMVLMKGGDTDTNAAIVGGAVACYHPIPADMKDQVYYFDATKKGRWHIRPKEYVPRYVLSQN